MTRGLIRLQETGNLHFITFSCYQRRPYLRTGQARSLFGDALERMRQRYSFYIVGYVVMPEHIHLLGSEPPDVPLAGVIKAIKLSVALRRRENPFLVSALLRFQRAHRKKPDREAQIYPSKPSN